MTIIDRALPDVRDGIRDMMCQYLGFSSNILVLDEITDALDAISCDRVVNFITTELQDIESVFVISHHSDELMLPSECEITVEKNENGVSSIK
jgi:ABC-type multidrug transport system ATPase subunit